MPLGTADLDGQERYRALGPRNLDEIAERFGLSPELRESTRMISHVLPFRVNEYVLEHLIDWDRVPEDPLFQLVFPRCDMLGEETGRSLERLSRRTRSDPGVKAEVARIRKGLNPHPSGQMELNVPRLDGFPLRGVQHKYRETVLYFPGQGQTCHAYCTYCFRWAQFVGDADLKFAVPGPNELLAYLRKHAEVTDVLVTGGDPMIMSTSCLRQHLEPLLGIDTVQTIRIGTKSVAYWPQRFVTDKDADDLLRLFERIVDSGRTCAVMAHFSHPREVEQDITREAIRRIRATGAVVYCQAPLSADRSAGVAALRPYVTNRPPGQAHRAPEGSPISGSGARIVMLTMP
jgi:L-lysine 2,3-aminomutase